MCTINSGKSKAITVSYTYVLCYTSSYPYPTSHTHTILSSLATQPAEASDPLVSGNVVFEVFLQLVPQSLNDCNVLRLEDLCLLLHGNHGACWPGNKGRVYIPIIE